MIGCYIIFSSSKDKFYVGVVQDDLQKRIEKHNSRFYDKSYTKFTSDWELYLFIPCDNFSQATHIEKHIKRMKSKTYIKNLKKYSNISKRLLEKYKST